MQSGWVKTGTAMSAAEQLAERLRLFAKLAAGLGDLLEFPLMHPVGVENQAGGKQEHDTDYDERRLGGPPSESDQRGPVERQEGRGENRERAGQGGCRHVWPLPDRTPPAG